MDSNYYFFTIWFVLLLFHVLITRTRYFNDPIKVLEDCGESIILRATALSMLLNSQHVTIEKLKIVKIQRAKNMISLFTHGNHAFDIWVVGKFTELIWQRAKTLFPDAKVVIIDELYLRDSGKG